MAARCNLCKQELPPGTEKRKSGGQKKFDHDRICSLRYEGKLKYREIAKEVGCSFETVKKVLAISRQPKV